MLRRIAVYFKPHVPSLIIAMICTIAIGAIAAATAWLVKPVLDDVFIKSDSTMLWMLPIFLLGLYFIKGVCRYSNAVIMQSVGQRVILKLRNDVMDRLQRREMAYFDQNDTGHIITKVVADVQLVQASIPSLIMFLRHAVTVIGLVGVLFARDFWLAAIALFVFPPAMIPVAKVSRKIRRVSKKAQHEMGGISKVLLETFGGIEVVKAFGFEQQVGDRFNEQGERVYRLRMKRERLNASVGPALEFLGAIGGAGIIWYGGSQVLEGHTTPGNFFSFMTALFMIYDPVVRMGKTNNQIQTALASAERVFQILDEELSPCETEGDQELDGDVNSVEVKDLHFSYKPDVEVLRGVDFQAKKGQIVALVGESGSGKSTLLKLLPRFYPPDSGSITVNGTDIRRFRVDSLRSKIAVVTQDAYLFDDTVFNNILMGRRDATRDEVYAAAKAARVDVFIDQLENGFDTMVGERGDLLSGGQKQRVTIARAILRDAPILILDEATSSLDSESEKEIQDALTKLMVGRTTFVIAHRLSTVLHADQILFMKEGVVAERGRHAELLERDGDYARLCKLQFGEE